MKDDCEPLTQKEWTEFLTNHWVHMKEEVAEVKSNINWLKWLNALIVAGLVGYIIKDFLN